MNYQIIGSDIMDDYMFQNVMEQPANCQAFLNSLFPGQKIRIAKIESQDRIKPTEMDKTTIMDIWAKDERDQLYDIEMQVGQQADRDLRAEFYSGRLINQSLSHSKNYDQRVKSYVIFIFPFDPFKGSGYRKYTIKYGVKETNSAHFQGISEIIYLNAKGTKGQISEDMNDFLKLMANQKVSKGKFITQIQKAMKNIGQTPKWKERSMVLQYRIEEERQKAKEAKIKAEETRKEMEQISIRTTLSALRKNKVSESNILATLTDSYGKVFSLEQIKRIMQKER